MNYGNKEITSFRSFCCHSISDQEVSASAAYIPHRQTEYGLFIPPFAGMHFSCLPLVILETSYYKHTVKNTSLCILHVLLLWLSCRSTKGGDDDGTCIQGVCVTCAPPQERFIFGVFLPKYTEQECASRFWQSLNNIFSTAALINLSLPSCTAAIIHSNHLNKQTRLAWYIQFIILWRCFFTGI